MRASLADIRRGERALVGACAFGGDVRAWCRREGVAVRAHVHAPAVVLGLRLPRAVESAGGGPELLGRLAGIACGRERAELVRVHARWLVSRAEAERPEARRAWARGAARTDPRADVADALRKEIARAMAAAEIELRAGVAHCIRIGLRPAELRRVADAPNLSALLARSSSFVDLVRRIKAGRRPDRTVHADPLPTPVQVRDDAGAGTLLPAGAESTDASDTDLSLYSKILALALMGAPFVGDAWAVDCTGTFAGLTCSGGSGGNVCQQSLGVITCDGDRSGAGGATHIWATSPNTNELIIYGTDSDGENFCCESTNDFSFTSASTSLDIYAGPGADRVDLYDVMTGYDLKCFDVYVDGEAGNDILVGSFDATYGDYLVGGDNDDNIVGNDGNDILYGDGGVDTMYGNAGDDKMDGGADNDVMEGNADLDEMKGGTGNDTLGGGSGNDLVCGGDNDDALYGGLGDDWVIGENGVNDTNDGGGGGYDECEFQNWTDCDHFPYNICPITW